MLSLLVNSALAATYYVDSVLGVDSNNGTSEGTPWKTIDKVNSVVFVPGDQVFFKRGSVWTGKTLVPTGNGSSTSPILFGAYGNGAPPLLAGNGSVENTVILWNKRHFTFQDFEITNHGASNATRCGIRVNYASTGIFSGLKILNNDIHSVQGMSVRSAMYYNAAIYVDIQEYQGSRTRVDSLLIEGNDIHDISCIGLYIKCPPYYGSEPQYLATNLKVRENIFDRTGADHIVVFGADTPIIEYNAGFDAGINGSGYGWIAGMWSSYFCKSPIFQFNEVARTRNERINDGDSQAFDCDLGAYGDNVFQYNYTHDNAGGVLLMMHENVAKNVVYRYNISVNDGRNTYYNNSMSIYPIQGVSTAHIYNNVFYTTRPEGLKFTDVGAAFYSNNIFYAPAAAYPTRPWFLNNCYFGHNPVVTDPFKVVSDPRFVGPLTATDGYSTVGGYRIQTTSPCINRGKTITNPISNGGRDFWGNPLYAGGHADIGAHEVPGGSGVPQIAPTIVDNPATSTLIYTGAWTHSADADFYGTTKSVSTTVGNSMQLSFSGRNVAIYGKKGPGIGKLNISVDGGPATLVDGYWPVDLFRAELFKVEGLSDGPHTLLATVAAKNAASSYNAIGIDYFQFEGGTPPPAAKLALIDSAPGSSVAYTGTWTHTTNDASYYYKTKSISSVIGDSVQFSFTGNGAILHGIKGPNCGRLNVSIDGGAPVLVDCYSPILDYRVPLFEVTGLTSGTHTLVATVVNKNTASTGNAVGIDFLYAVVGRSNLDNPPAPTVVYSGAWTHSTDLGYFGGTKSVSNTVGNYVQFTFSGSSAKLYAKKGAGIGKLSISIDGGTPTLVDCYATTDLYQVEVFSVNGLPPGSHTLRATVATKNPAASGNFIGIDFLNYQP